jgi:HEAT repeat protein
MTSKIENIKKNLEDESFDIRKKAVRELARQDSPEAIGLLIDCLADDNADIVSQAVKGLTEKGEDAIPELIGALKNPSWTIRKQASKALVGIGTKSLDPIISAMRSGDEDVQFWAGEVLSEFGEDGLDKFLALLADKSQSSRLCAIGALGKIGSEKAVNPLIAQLGEDSWTIRKAAAEALWEIGQPSVKELIERLKAPNADIQFWSIQILGEIGDVAAVKPLIQKLDDGEHNEEKKISIIKALGEIEDPFAIDTLIDQLGSSSWFVRRAAGEALWQIGPPAIKPLRDSLNSEIIDIRYWCSKVLGEMQAREAVPDLINLLGDEEWSIRSGAAYALGEIGDESSAETLIKHLDDPNEIVRKNVVIALGQIGDAKAIHSSTDALEDESEWVRRYAAETLEKLKEKKIDNNIITGEICSKCRGKLETLWKFCPFCGKELEQ